MSMKPEKKTKLFSVLRRIAQAAAVVLAVLGITFCVRALLNKAFLSNYNAGTYSEFPENLLSTFPLGESYIAPYNEGNVEYHLGKYDRAVRYYAQALEDRHIPRERECRIRVNMALALCHTVDWDSLDQSDGDAVSKAVDTLLLARRYLTEKGCAVELAGVSGGHSREAEKLKADIDRMLEKLMQNQNDESSSSDSSSGSSNNDSSSQDSNSTDSGSDSQKSQTDEEKQEQERQEALERALDDQKEELGGDDVTITDDEGHVYSYKEGGSTEGYGEGTPW